MIMLYSCIIFTFRIFLLTNLIKSSYPLIVYSISQEIIAAGYLSTFGPYNTVPKKALGFWKCPDNKRVTFQDSRNRIFNYYDTYTCVHLNIPIQNSKANYTWQSFKNVSTLITLCFNTDIQLSSRKLWRPYPPK